MSKTWFILKLTILAPIVIFMATMGLFELTLLLPFQLPSFLFIAFYLLVVALGTGVLFKKQFYAEKPVLPLIRGTDKLKNFINQTMLLTSIYGLLLIFIVTLIMVLGINIIGFILEVL